MSTRNDSKKPFNMTFQGVVEAGIGQGKMYISKTLYKDQITRLFSFVPFPGTLNIKVSQYLYNRILNFVQENGSVLGGTDTETEGRKLFNVLAHPCKIEGVDAVVLFPEKSIHDDEIEIIADIYLREKLDLKDGDAVNIELQNVDEKIPDLFAGDNETSSLS